MDGCAVCTATWVVFTHSHRTVRVERGKMVKLYVYFTTIKRFWEKCIKNRSKSSPRHMDRASFGSEVDLAGGPLPAKVAGQVPGFRGLCASPEKWTLSLRTAGTTIR